MSFAWVRGLLVVSACSLSIAGCAFVPTEGPLASKIERGAVTTTGSNYTVVDVNAEVAAVLAEFAKQGLHRRFGGGGPAASDTIGVGDVLGVSIYEAGPDGLFSTMERKQTDVRVTVDASGQISVPYAGRIKVAGRNPAEVRTAIVAALRERALEPDVTVEVMTNNSRVVMVGGAVGAPQRVPLGLGEERVLDVITVAGGSRFPAHETLVSLVRNGTEERVLLQTLINNPDENVFVRPGDRIFLIQDAQTFTAFGAVTQRGKLPFGEEKISLIEAAALAGGLSDERADATGLFLFRYESADAVRRMMPDRVGLATGGASASIPIVYRFNLQEPSSFLFAQNFPMRDKDVIYVANHPTAELAKFFAIIGGLNEPVDTYQNLSGAGSL